MRQGSLVLGAGVLALGAGCGGTAETPPTFVPDVVPHFAIRGRLPGKPELRLFLDGQGSPVTQAAFRSAVAEAITRWNATGLVELQITAEREDSGAIVAWRRGAHDQCQPFGYDTSVAHAGPLTAQSFVHLDADRTWSPDVEGAHPLTQVLTHELGHLVGLDHSLDPAAVMHPNYDRRRAIPKPSDLAGLASLYGGMNPGPGDLYVEVPLDGEAEPLLRRIAPDERTGFALFDVDHDGRDEVLVWRTDAEGHGRLMIYHFNSAMLLESTDGPILDCVYAGARSLLATTMEGDAVLLSVLPDDRYAARRFGKGGLPEVVPRGSMLVLREGFADNDGDGVFDTLPIESQGRTSSDGSVGDLNGDGRQERVTTR